MLLGTTILVVDDNEELREILSLGLTQEGAIILQASDGKIAFDLIQQNPIDVVLSDVRMPGGSGIELLDRVAKLPTQPILIMMSGFSDLGPNEAKMKNVAALLNKPFKRKELLEILVRNLNLTGKIRHG